MVNAFLSTLLTPLTPEDPCGPDLDFAGDMDFSNTLARSELILPGSYFTISPQDGESKPFDRNSVKFAVEIASVAELLKRTRDLRVTVVLAKFAILDRNLPDFVDIVEAMGESLKTWWELIHPREEGDHFALRCAILNALNDWDHVVYPLQFVPLVRHPRHGSFAFRAKMLLDGTPPRTGEEQPNAAEFERAFSLIDLPELIEQRDRFVRLQQALQSIKDLTEERLGASEAVDLPLVRTLTDQILDFLESWVARRDPTAARQPLDQPGKEDLGANDDKSTTDQPSDGIRSFADVAATLNAIASFLRDFEPSSPALPLVLQAEQLVGRSLADVIGILLPNHLEAATIGIGRNELFRVPLNRLPASGESSFSESAANIKSGSILKSVLKSAAIIKSTTNAPTIGSRNAALSALQQIEAFYATSEPTSPVPFFCERARKLATRDFMSILKDILPEHTLQAIEGQ